MLIPILRPTLIFVIAIAIAIVVAIVSSIWIVWRAPRVGLQGGLPLPPPGPTPQVVRQRGP
eukprot:1972123-Alexandrium_andersonii.AAC.1